MATLREEVIVLGVRDPCVFSLLELTKSKKEEKCKELFLRENDWPSGSHHQKNHEGYCKSPCEGSCEEILQESSHQRTGNLQQYV